MRRFIPLLTVMSLAFAPAPLPRPDKKPDREQMRGVWVLHSWRCDGKTEVLEAEALKTCPEAQWEVSPAVIEKTDAKIQTTGASGTGTWQIVLNPAAKPKEMTLSCGLLESDIRAIYALESDTLTVCYHATDWLARPKDITGKAPNQVVRVYKRKKP